MRKNKAKRITKPSIPTESLNVDDLLVKWAIECVNPEETKGETYASSSLKANSPEHIDYERLK